MTTAAGSNHLDQDPRFDASREIRAPVGRN